MSNDSDPIVPTPDVDEPAETSPKGVNLDDPLVKLLASTEFVVEENLTEDNLNNVPEYVLLKKFVEEERLTLEFIKNEVNHPLAPVALRNLLSAEIVNEVKENEIYELTEDTKAKLN